ncbi:MAG: tetratricopeptide repeat protein [Candidatus Sulfotelmatobacter sp.]
MSVQGLSPQEKGQRLDSWKAIAEYLGRDVRSVQRWERGLGLPVHRVSGEKGGVVFAFTAEIENWLRGRPGSGNSAGNAFPSDSAWAGETEVAAKVPTVAHSSASAGFDALPATEGATVVQESVKTASGLARTRYTVAVVVLVLIGCVIYVAGRSSSPSADTPPSETRRIKLAVLPFVNLSGDPAQQYFADGLTEEMITVLGSLNPQALGVIARTSAMKYKDTKEDVAQIGRELGVSYIVEGSVRREGNEARISAQLVQVSDQTHIWAQNYDLQVTDILSLQRDAAATIADKIQVRLAEQRTPAQVGSSNSGAYDDYLHGRYALSQRNEEGFRKALVFFSQAIAKDPNFALAYAGLADSEVLLSFVGKASSAEAKVAALKALALDDNLAEAHTSLAAVYVLDWNWPGAEKEFKRALALNPNYALAHHWYGNLYLSPMGRHADAIADLEQARELDPLSLIVNTDLGYAYFFAGQYDLALAQYQKVEAMDPSFVSLHWVLWQYYAQLGNDDLWARELSECSRLDGNLDLAQEIQSIYKKDGRKKLLEFIAIQDSSSRFGLENSAVALAAMGRKNEALEDLEAAYQLHEADIIRIKVDPAFASLRDEPGFRELVKKIGLTSKSD